MKLDDLREESTEEISADEKTKEYVLDTFAEMYKAYAEKFKDSLGLSSKEVADKFSNDIMPGFFDFCIDAEHTFGSDVTTDISNFLGIQHGCWLNSIDFMNKYHKAYPSIQLATGIIVHKDDLIKINEYLNQNIVPVNIDLIKHGFILTDDGIFDPTLGPNQDYHYFYKIVPESVWSSFKYFYNTEKDWWVADFADWTGAQIASAKESNSFYDYVGVDLTEVKPDNVDNELIRNEKGVLVSKSASTNMSVSKEVRNERGVVIKSDSKDEDSDETHKGESFGESVLELKEAEEKEIGDASHPMRIGDTSVKPGDKLFTVPINTDDETLTTAIDNYLEDADNNLIRNVIGIKIKAFKDILTQSVTDSVKQMSSDNDFTQLNVTGIGVGLDAAKTFYDMYNIKSSRTRDVAGFNESFPVYLIKHSDRIARRDIDTNEDVKENIIYCSMCQPYYTYQFSGTTRPNDSLFNKAVYDDMINHLAIKQEEVTEENEKENKSKQEISHSVDQQTNLKFPEANETDRKYYLERSEISDCIFSFLTIVVPNDGVSKVLDVIPESSNGYSRHGLNKPVTLINPNNETYQEDATIIEVICNKDEAKKYVTALNKYQFDKNNKDKYFTFEALYNSNTKTKDDIKERIISYPLKGCKFDISIDQLGQGYRDDYIGYPTNNLKDLSKDMNLNVEYELTNICLKIDKRKYFLYQFNKSEDCDTFITKYKAVSGEALKRIKGTKVVSYSAQPVRYLKMHSVPNFDNYPQNKQGLKQFLKDKSLYTRNLQTTSNFNDNLKQYLSKIQETFTIPPFFVSKKIVYKDGETINDETILNVFMDFLNKFIEHYRIEYYYKTRYYQLPIRKINWFSTVNGYNYADSFTKEHDLDKLDNISDEIVLRRAAFDTRIDNNSYDRLHATLEKIINSHNSKSAGSRDTVSILLSHLDIKGFPENYVEELNETLGNLKSLKEIRAKAQQLVNAIDIKRQDNKYSPETDKKILSYRVMYEAIFNLLNNEDAVTDILSEIQDSSDVSVYQNALRKLESLRITFNASNDKVPYFGPVDLASVEQMTSKSLHALTSSDLALLSRASNKEDGNYLNLLINDLNNTVDDVFNSSIKDTLDKKKEDNKKELEVLQKGEELEWAGETVSASAFGFSFKNKGGFLIKDDKKGKIFKVVDKDLKGKNIKGEPTEFKVGDFVKLVDYDTNGKTPLFQLYNINTDNVEEESYNLVNEIVEKIKQDGLEAKKSFAKTNYNSPDVLYINNKSATHESIDNSTIEVIYEDSDEELEFKRDNNELPDTSNSYEDWETFTDPDSPAETLDIIRNNRILFKDVTNVLKFCKKYDIHTKKDFSGDTFSYPDDTDIAIKYVFGPAGMTDAVYERLDKYYTIPSKYLTNKSLNQLDNDFQFCLDISYELYQKGVISYKDLEKAEDSGDFKSVYNINNNVMNKYETTEGWPEFVSLINNYFFDDIDTDIDLKVKETAKNQMTFYTTTKLTQKMQDVALKVMGIPFDFTAKSILFTVIENKSATHFIRAQLNDLYRAHFRASKILTNGQATRIGDSDNIAELFSSENNFTVRNIKDRLVRYFDQLRNSKDFSFLNKFFHRDFNKLQNREELRLTVRQNIKSFADAFGTDFAFVFDDTKVPFEKKAEYLNVITDSIIDLMDYYTDTKAKRNKDLKDKIDDGRYSLKEAKRYYYNEISSRVLTLREFVNNLTVDKADKDALNALGLSTDVEKSDYIKNFKESFETYVECMFTILNHKKIYYKDKQDIEGMKELKEDNYNKIAEGVNLFGDKSDWFCYVFNQAINLTDSYEILNKQIKKEAKVIINNINQDGQKKEEELYSEWLSIVQGTSLDPDEEKRDPSNTLSAEEINRANMLFEEYQNQSNRNRLQAYFTKKMAYNNDIRTNKALANPFYSEIDADKFLDPMEWAKRLLNNPSSEKLNISNAEREYLSIFVERNDKKNTLPYYINDYKEIRKTIESKVNMVFNDINEYLNKEVTYVFNTKDKHLKQTTIKKLVKKSSNIDILVNTIKDIFSEILTNETKNSKGSSAFSTLKFLVDTLNINENNSEKETDTKRREQLKNTTIPENKKSIINHINTQVENYKKTNKDKAGLISLEDAALYFTSDDSLKALQEIFAKKTSNEEKKTEVKDFVEKISRFIAYKKIQTFADEFIGYLDNDNILEEYKYELNSKKNKDVQKFILKHFRKDDFEKLISSYGLTTTSLEANTDAGLSELNNIVYHIFNNVPHRLLTSVREYLDKLVNLQQKIKDELREIDYNNLFQKIIESQSDLKDIVKDLDKKLEEKESFYTLNKEFYKGVQEVITNYFSSDDSLSVDMAEVSKKLGEPDDKSEVPEEHAKFISRLSNALEVISRKYDIKQFRDATSDSLVKFVNLVIKDDAKDIKSIMKSYDDVQFTPLEVSIDGLESSGKTTFNLTNKVNKFESWEKLNNELTYMDYIRIRNIIGNWSSDSFVEYSELDINNFKVKSFNSLKPEEIKEFIQLALDNDFDKEKCTSWLNMTCYYIDTNTKLNYRKNHLFSDFVEIFNKEHLNCLDINDKDAELINDFFMNDFTLVKDFMEKNKQEIINYMNNKSETKLKDATEVCEKLNLGPEYCIFYDLSYIHSQEEYKKFLDMFKDFGLSENVYNFVYRINKCTRNIVRGNLGKLIFLLRPAKVKEGKKEVEKPADIEKAKAYANFLFDVASKEDLLKVFGDSEAAKTLLNIFEKDDTIRINDVINTLDVYQTGDAPSIEIEDNNVYKILRDNEEFKQNHQTLFSRIEAISKANAESSDKLDKFDFEVFEKNAKTNIKVNSDTIFFVSDLTERIKTMLLQFNIEEAGNLDEFIKYAMFSDNLQKIYNLVIKYQSDIKDEETLVKYIHSGIKVVYGEYVTAKENAKAQKDKDEKEIKNTRDEIQKINAGETHGDIEALNKSIENLENKTYFKVKDNDMAYDLLDIYKLVSNVVI